MTTILAGLAGVLALLHVAMASKGRAAGAVGAVLVVWGHSYLRGPDALGDLLRVGALFVLAVPALRRRTPKSERQQPAVMIVAAGGGVIYAVAAVADGFASGTVLAGASLLGSLAVVYVVTTSHCSEALARAFVTSLGAACASTSLLVVALPALAVQGERWRGAFVNANTLAFFCGLVILFLLFHRTLRPVPTGLLLLGSAVALFYSGSRSALLALTVGTVVGAVLAATRLKRRGPALAIALSSPVTVYFVIAYAQKAFILRREDSREVGNTYALSIADWSLVRGVGFGSAPVEIAGTPLRFLAEVGLLSFIIICVLYAGVLLLGYRSGPGPMALATFGVVSSIFEGWYLAGGSGLFMAYWILFSFASSEASSNLRRRGADSATNPGVQPVSGTGGQDPRHLQIRR